MPWQISLNFVMHACREPVNESFGNAGPRSSTMMAIANAARWAEPATTEG